MFIQRIIAFFTALVYLLAGFLGAGESCIEKAENFRVTTYIRADYVQSPESLYTEDFDIITDAILFECATFDNEGNVNIEKDKLETALANIRKAIGDKDVRITLNLLGPSGHTDSDVWEDQMEAQSDEHNKAFTSGVLEDNIVAVLERYDFDGVHFDYEYPLSLKAWHYYNKFLVSLDKKLGNYTLGVACNDWNIKFSTKAIAAVDTFEIMLYDMNDENGRHSTYEDMTDMVRKVGFYGIPLEKVNIGLPFYSRPTDMSGYWYGYNGSYEDIDENGWYHCNDTGKDFWFNTPDVIAQKTDFAIRNGYGGVMIWHYNCDLPSTHEDSLLRAIGETVEAAY
ncbi:MAG: glycoside hydrolase family 18 protein [Clostridia bacterium]|nr:glycoside hydrolase family 18 protein [Clostridia bacterium]